MANKTNMEAIKIMIGSILNMIKTTKLDYDKTYTGRVKTSLGGNFYVVEIKGNDYTLRCLNMVSLNVNDTVKVLSPQGNDTNMFILGKI